MPGAALAVAEKLTLLVVLVVAGVKLAVTPLGRPVAARVTGALKFCGLRTLMVALGLLPPLMTLRLLADEEIVKLGVGTVTVRVVDAVSEPEVPVMVIVALPGVAELLAVNVSTLLPVVGLVEKAAVTPLGRPDAARVTLPVNPFWPVTARVDLPDAP